MVPEYAPRGDEKRIQWLMKIDPKLKSLASDAAKDDGISLSSFVENAIKVALAEKEEIEVSEEATPGTEPDLQKLSRRLARQSRQLWGEKLLWDDDKANRFFIRANHRFDLLSEPEKRFWQFFVLSAKEDSRRTTKKAFRDFWNSTNVDTSHLGEEE